ncbi:LPO_1073/Vpar_1526 family protein [Halarcobacter ebronensis]|uniref:LPO_1073/Vpar_1526 family protein n=1 Tax=Halarcobacter ebronensis TaxID=1462615 RepID=UPI003C74ED0F
MISKQNQESGDNSTNIQADNLVVNVSGIDEKRAREIFSEMNLQLKNDYTIEALRIANNRVSDFENILMPKMEKVEGALEAFSDPSFQLLLVEAQKTSASTERPADYELLSELLLHRFKKGNDRVVRAGINRAVDIVDEISDDSLLGLTVFHSVSNFIPTSGDIKRGLHVLDDLFGKVIYDELPLGKDWLDHLEMLNTIRLNLFGNLKKLEEYYPLVLSGYIDVGIEKNSENHNKALEILSKEELPSDILVEHALNDNYLRLEIANKEHINDIQIESSNGKFGQIKVFNPLTKKQITAANSIYALYNRDQVLKEQNIKLFFEEWDKKPNLKKLKDWWNGLTNSIQVTSVGKVLAHSNAQRCSPNLPPLD